jgi:hypothetical protein
MSTQRFSDSLRQRGIVLPVVLVMLVLMTTVVLYLMRRGAVDERMAANFRDITTVDSAAHLVLRRCELMLWVSPPGLQPQPGRPDPPRVIPAPVAPAAAAWQVNANWDNSSVFIGANAAEANALMPGVAEARCLIEDATGELELSAFEQGNRLNLANQWRKYRITAEVQGQGAGALRLGRAQSEMRMTALPN